jgi:NADH:ubiquinone oxidoreductase subunit 2 (subunit N)
MQTLNMYWQSIICSYGLNIIAYISSLLIIIFILIIINKSSTIYSNELSLSNNINQIKFTIIVALLSLSGLPPLFGFFSKFFLILVISNKNQWIILFLFCTFNLFSLYFYFQQLRYVSNNNKKKEFNTLLNKVYLNINLNYLNVTLALSCFGGVLLEIISTYLYVLVA